MFLVSLDDFVISKERFIKWSKDVYLSLCYVNKGRKYFKLAKSLDTHVLLEMRTFVLEHRVKIIQKFYEHSFNICWDQSFSTYAKFSEKLKFLTSLIRRCTCAYQGVGNVSFSKNFAYVLNECYGGYLF